MVAMSMSPNIQLLRIIGRLENVALTCRVDCPDLEDAVRDIAADLTALVGELPE